MLGSAVSVRVCVDHIGHSCEAEMLPICGVYKKDLHLLLDQVPSVIIQSITRLFQRFVFEKLKECLNEKGPRDPLYFLTDKKLKGYQRRLEEEEYKLHQNDHISAQLRAEDEERDEGIRLFEFDGTSPESLKIGQFFISENARKQ